MWEDKFSHGDILLCYCSLSIVLLLIAGMYVTSINHLLMIGLTCPVILFLEIVLFILYWSFHNAFTYTVLESIFLCSAGKYKDWCFQWESVVVGACACPCNSSHWSEAMHLSKYWSPMEFFIPDSYNSFLMEVFPILKRGSNFFDRPLVGT